MTHFAADERHALADLLVQVGPDAPTLCAGWTAADLAAHIVIRERRLDAALGIILKPLAHRTQQVQDKVKNEHSYPQLVHLVRTGPPQWNPMGWGSLAEVSNLAEFFVHHEDVRRAQHDWQPRTLTAELEDAIWHRLQRMGRLLLRSAPVGVRLTSPGRSPLAPQANRPVQVELTGAPSELMFFCYGRQQATKVSVVALDGSASHVSALYDADLGV